jgi:hypothetical protein
MEFKNTLEIVTKDIQDIEKLVSNFKNYSRIPNIELDLALSRLRNLYDLLLMFREDSNGNSGMVEKEIIPDTTIALNDSKILEESALQPPATPVVANVNEIEPEVISETPVIAEKPVIKKKPEEEKVYINEKLGEKTIKKDVSSKLQGQAIKNIAGSIGINDKFFFIRELFSGSAETFRLTMDELDEAHNFNDAYSLLMSKFQWDMDSEPVQLLLNLIRRKFITAGNE